MLEKMERTTVVNADGERRLAATTFFVHINLVQAAEQGFLTQALVFKGMTLAEARRVVLHEVERVVRDQRKTGMVDPYEVADVCATLYMLKRAEGSRGTHTWQPVRDGEDVAITCQHKIRVCVTFTTDTAAKVVVLHAKVGFSHH